MVLTCHGSDARLLWFADENHWILKPRNSRQWYGEFFGWLLRHGAHTSPPRVFHTPSTSGAPMPGLVVQTDRWSLYAVPR